MKLTLTKTEAQDFILRNNTMGLDSVEIHEGSPTVYVSPTFTPPTEGRMLELIQDARKAHRENNKIGAIKALREATGWGLRDSKNWVEACWGLPPY